MTLLTLFWCCLATIGYILLRLRIRQHRLPFPPGPPPKFFSGNIHQLPPGKAWLTYLQWSGIYGPIISYRTYGRRIVVLNTAKAVLDLLEARGLIYSDRPTNWMVRLADRHLSVFWIHSTHPRFKKYRKMLQSGLSARNVSSHYALLRDHSLSLMQKFRREPDMFISHIQRSSASLILRLAYGYTPSQTEDSFTSAMERANLGQIQLLKPGWLVEHVPALRFIPTWFPWASFKRVAEGCKTEMREIEAAPFSWAKMQINSGKHTESFMSEQLELLDTTLPDCFEEEQIIKWCSAALYAGGADTMPSAIKSFLLAMTLFPECQKRAQREIDQVVGPDHLPEIRNQADLTYVSALITEVLRWAPVGPLGLPHCVTEDDVYNNYFIPKGTTVIANIWAITRDPEIYPDPNTFSPERYLGDNAQTDPRRYLFGFGRRVCPGQSFVHASLFQTISHFLALFDVSKALDETGAEVDPVVDFTSGPASHPVPFKCRIMPRSAEALALLDAASGG